jgi:hypothetical protein
MAKFLPYRILVLLAVAASPLPATASALANTVHAIINGIVGPQETTTTGGLPALLYQVDLTLLDPNQVVVSSVGW